MIEYRVFDKDILCKKIVARNTTWRQKVKLAMLLVSSDWEIVVRAYTFDKNQSAAFHSTSF